MPANSARCMIVAAALAACCSVGQAKAEDVVLFKDRVPSVPELADLLWPAPKAAPPGGRSRSVWAKDNLDLAPGVTAGGAAAAEPRGFGLIIQFRFDSTEIIPESRAYLDRGGQLLLSEQAENRGIDIVGHTDASGADTYN